MIYSPYKVTVTEPSESNQVILECGLESTFGIKIDPCMVKTSQQNQNYEKISFLSDLELRTFCTLDQV